MSNRSRPDAPETAPHWPRRIALTLFVLIALVFLGHLGWGKLAGRRLAQTVARYQAAGEPMTVEDLASPAVPDEENAAPLLRAAAAAVNDKSEAWVAVEKLDPPLLPLTEKEAVRITQVVAENRDALEKDRRAAGMKGIDWKLSLASPMVQMSLPDLNPQRKNALLLRAAALHAHVAGDDAEAVRRVREMLFVARAVDRQPTVITHLVALGIAALATGTLEQIAPDLQIAGTGETPLRGKPAPAEDVKALVAELLDPVPLIEGQQRAYRGERVMQIDTATAVVAGKLSLNSLLIASTSGLNLPSGSLMKPLVLADARWMADYMARVIEAAGSPDLPTARPRMPTALLEELKGSYVRHPFAAVMLPSLDRANEQTYRAVTEHRLAAAAVAARWYALDHGGVAPGGWNDLVPAYLPAVPLDALSAGQPLRYLPGADPIFYSVGPDGIDDGGSEAPTKPNDPRPSDWTRKDRVLHLNRQPRPPADEGEE